MNNFEINVSRLFLISSVVFTSIAVSACVSDEQRERNEARAAIPAASKDVVLDACYPIVPTEVENAKSLLASEGGSSAVYWSWRVREESPQTLARVNAKSSVDLTSSCMQRIASSCSSLGFEPTFGSVSRQQAAAGLGEIKITCSPRLEQL